VSEGERERSPRSYFEIALALALLASLVAAALAILAPLALVLLWAVFIAVTLWPVHCFLASRLGGRDRLAAAASVLLFVVVPVLPLTFAAAAVLPSIRTAASLLSEPSAWRVPVPPEWIRGVPVFGGDLHEIWASLSEDAGLVLQVYRPQVTQFGTWLAARALGLGLALVELFVAVVIAAPLLAEGLRGARLVRRLAERVGGEDAVHLLEQAARTIRSISVGVVGTAFAVAALQALGLLAAGVPHAALLGVLGFLLAMAQLGTGLVWVGAAIWLSYAGHSQSAILTVAWGIAINYAVDGVAKAILIRRGTGLPLTIIFLGVIGGLLSWGFVGVFLGPTLLGVAWTLLRAWLAASPAPAAEGTGGVAPPGAG